MGSGVIFVFIIAMWAVYFVPRWLRRYEELSEARSVERFSRAMRILSRKDPTPDQRYVVMPRRPDEESEREPRRGRLRRLSPLRPVRALRRGLAARRDRLARRPASRPVRTATIVARRRRVVSALVLLLVVTVVLSLSPVAALPWWSPLVVVGLLLLDVVHLRMQARRRAELTRSRAAVRQRTRKRLRRFDSAERIVESRRAIAAERAAAHEAEEAAGRADAERREAAAAGWQPVPVPLPTYVSKPVAGRPAARTIDLTVPGAWTESAYSPASGPLVEEEPFDQQAYAGPPPPSRLEEPGDELEAIIDRRPAVGD